jgi:hypothetical protein
LTAIIQSDGAGVQFPPDAGADIANNGRGDLDVRIHLLRLDINLDELLRRVAPGLALAVA